MDKDNAYREYESRRHTFIFKEDGVVQGRTGLEGENDRVMFQDLLDFYHVRDGDANLAVYKMCGACGRSPQSNSDVAGTCQLPLIARKVMAKIDKSCNYAVVGYKIPGDSPTWVRGRRVGHGEETNFESDANKTSSVLRFGKIGRTELHNLANMTGGLKANFDNADGLLRDGDFPTSQVHGVEEPKENKVSPKGRENILRQIRKNLG